MTDHAVVKSSQDFTVDLYKKVAGKSDGNLVSSALSVHVVLAMAASGADDNTARELKKALHLESLDQSDALSGFNNFISACNNVTDVTLKLANKIYVSHRLNVKDKFKDLTKTHFHSDSETVDFTQAAAACKSINQWCSDKTNEKIKELIKEGDVNDDTAMVLLNAVYFKGDWKDKFDVNRTQMKEFHLNKTDTVKVPTMHISEKFPYGEIKDLNATYVKIPYKNPDMFMVVVVPNEIDGLKDVENNLEKLYDHIFEKQPAPSFFRSDKVHLSLPKFKIETTIEMNPHLQELGLKEMFSPKANFNGISDQRLNVSKVVQKAFIEVNEEGAEAAAVTGVMVQLMCALPEPMIIDVNRPFLYKIFYKNAALFTGRVVNPLS